MAFSADPQGVGRQQSDELPHLLAWLGSTTAAPPLVTREDVKARSDFKANACAYIRRQPLQSIALAAAGGFLMGMFWGRR